MKTLILSTFIIYAANITIPFTNGQNTYVQNTLIPQANAAKCVRWGQAPGCTTAEVEAAGCVDAPFSAVTKTNLVYRNCNIHASDATGEAAYAAEQLHMIYLERVTKELAEDVEASCAAFKSPGTSGASRNAACAAIGRPNGCRICR